MNRPLTAEEKAAFVEDVERGIEEVNVEFWSKNFNEHVFRLCTIGKIPYDVAQHFLNTDNGFVPKIIALQSKYMESEKARYLMH